MLIAVLKHILFAMTCFICVAGRHNRTA